MKIETVTHIALRVSNLHEAENYYAQLFELDVAWREAETSAGWFTLPDDKTWDDAKAAGIALDLVFLWRDGFSLALEQAHVLNADGALSHIGLLVDQSMFDVLRDRVPKLQCAIHSCNTVTMVFDDRYGVRWEPTIQPYENPKAQSSGARSSRWLVL